MDHQDGSLVVLFVAVHAVAGSGTSMVWHASHMGNQYHP